MMCGSERVWTKRLYSKVVVEGRETSETSLRIGYGGRYVGDAFLGYVMRRALLYGACSKSRSLAPSNKPWQRGSGLSTPCNPLRSRVIVQHRYRRFRKERPRARRTNRETGTAPADVVQAYWWWRIHSGPTLFSLVSQNGMAR
jgi:hypothetical protein